LATVPTTVTRIFGATRCNSYIIVYSSMLHCSPDDRRPRWWRPSIHRRQFFGTFWWRCRSVGSDRSTQSTNTNTTTSHRRQQSLSLSLLLRIGRSMASTNDGSATTAYDDDTTTDTANFPFYTDDSVDPGYSLLIATLIFCVLSIATLPCMVAVGMRFRNHETDDFAAAASESNITTTNNGNYNARPSEGDDAPSRAAESKHSNSITWTA
jgi:hypothetical protein